MNREGSSFYALTAAFAPDLSEPFFAPVMAEVGGDQVAETLPFISRAVLARSETEPLLGHTLEGRLRTRGLIRISVVIGLRAINTRMLRERYGA